MGGRVWYGVIFCAFFLPAIYLIKIMEQSVSLCGKMYRDPISFHLVERKASEGREN